MQNYHDNIYIFTLFTVLKIIDPYSACSVKHKLGSKITVNKIKQFAFRDNKNSKNDNNGRAEQCHLNLRKMSTRKRMINNLTFKQINSLGFTQVVFYHSLLLH